MRLQTLPKEFADQLADVLARVVADVERQGRKEVELLAAKIDVLSAKAEGILSNLEAKIARSDGEFCAQYQKYKEQVQVVLSALKDGKDGAPGENGKDADPAVIEKMVADTVASYIAEIPEPKNGKDADISQIRLMVAEEVAKIPSAVDGKHGRDGVDGKDGRDGIDGSNGEDGADGKEGTPGRDGRDGAPGLSGKDGAPGLAGKDGADGKDGHDGFGLEDFDVETLDDFRTITLAFSRGDVVKKRDLKTGAWIDRGVYRAGQEYDKGDVVTFGGSAFLARHKTTDKPETDAWRMIVKRGRDGKDGIPGPKGDKGDPGRDGKDLTQLGPDGRKW